MATVRELITKIGYKVDEKGLKEAEKKTSKFASIAKGAIIGTVGAVLGIGVAAVKAAGDMEMLTTQFEVMLGSTEKATAMMNELKTFAAATPFALEDLAKGSQQLLSFGVAEDEVIQRMRMLGDTAGGNAEKLNGLVLAYGKVTTKGKASMEELNMLAERGLPIFEILSTKIGVSREELFKMVSKGKISAQDITESFEIMTSEGGMFFEGMKKQSLTFHGLVSTMKDNFKLLLAEIGTTLLPVMKEVVSIITELVQGGLGDLIKTLAEGFIPIVKLLASLLKPLIKALTPVLKALIKALAPFIKILEMLLLPIIEALMPLFDLLALVLEKVGKQLQALIPWIIPILVKAVELIGWFIQVAVDGIMWLFDNISGAITWIIDAFNGMMDAIVNAIKSVAEWLGFEGERTVKDMESSSKEKEKIQKQIQNNTMNNIKKTNIAINNKIKVDGKAGVGTAKGMGEIARSVFSIEVQKIIMNGVA